jgi:hypothetical protein
MHLKLRSHTHDSHMHYSYTGGRRKTMSFHLDPPKNVLLLHWEWTPKICLIGYPLNKCSKVLVTISQKFCCKKKKQGYAKVIHEKKRGEKNGQVSEISKTIGTQMPTWKKREMNKIAHVLSQKLFQVSKERYVSKEHSSIRLATIYIHIHPHTCTSWFNCMTQLSLDLRFDFTIYVLQVCFFMLSPLLWAPHKP